MLRKLKKALPAIVSAILCVTMVLGITASAHPGRTDSNGGHYDRSTGTYHTHNGGGSSSSSSSSSSSTSYTFENKNTTTKTSDNKSTTNSAASVWSETKALTTAKYNSNYIKWVEKYSAKDTKNTVTFGKSRTKKFYEKQLKTLNAEEPQFALNLVTKD